MHALCSTRSVLTGSVMVLTLQRLKPAINVIFKGLSIFSCISLIKKHLFEANSLRARLLPICQVRELIRLPLLP
jgi:hypothetical protein